MKHALVAAAAALLACPLAAEPAGEVVLTIPSTAQFPRNSEGSFATLKSGRIIFCYSQFFGGSGDDSSARIAEVHSDDQGRTWSSPGAFAEKGEAANLMSVSLLRLASGKLAIFYIVKRAGGWLQADPVMRISSDEGATWSDPRRVVAAPGYWELNNDRAVQLRGGRIILPVARYRSRGMEDTEASFDPRGIVFWFYSDDEGATWRESNSWWGCPAPSRGGLQEPGVVELADGSLLSWARTDLGCQFSFRSSDGGLTWSPPEPTELRSPMSPASIKRLPGSVSLLAVYNDHSGFFPFASDGNPYRGRTPLVAAVSADGGRTWPLRRLLEGDSTGAFAYIAIHFAGNAALLAYTVGIPNGPSLGTLRIRRVPVPWLLGNGR